MRRRNAAAAERARAVETIRQYLERRREIQCAYLHGSFARGEPYHDVDVAVWVDRGRAGDDSLAGYAVELAAELSEAAGHLVEIQILNRAPLAFRYQVLSGQPLFARDPEWLDELRARIWDDYFDFLPFARQYLLDLSGV